MRITNQCLRCVHFDNDVDDPEAHPTCAAFPGGIPFEIWEDGEDHRVPFQGDNGIQFEPVPGADQEALSRWDGPAEI